MKQLNLKVDEKVQESFYEFCRDQGISPYELLGAIVGFYGRAQMITRGRDKGTLSNEEALIQIGYVIRDMQKVARANGEFLKAVAVLLEPHGVDLSNLWPNWKESGEKVRA